MTPFIAETTTMTFDDWAAVRARPAACAMRSAPSRELPPNFKAMTFWRGLARLALAATTKHPATEASTSIFSCTCSGLMTSAPDFRWSVSGGGLKEETHRLIRFRRWVGNFY